MIGATPPLPHTHSWHAQGNYTLHLNCTFQEDPKEDTEISEWDRLLIVL